MKRKYIQAPGRGLMSETAVELRKEYLDSMVNNITKDLNSENIELSQIQNNIESYIGTIEIPLGLIGPLLFHEKDQEAEWILGALATTEGALTASLNRGAKAISQSNGFRAHIVHQKMLRTPMFTFTSMADAIVFIQWVKRRYQEIKSVTKDYSNYAELLEISSILVGKIVHLKFIYSTSDASGQNMTTACTWNACLWIQSEFPQDFDIKILNFVIDGNGASDKKVSFYSILNGRGTHVISECFLTNEVVEKTLRTTADDMFQLYIHSMAISRMDGMIGYNANVANAIAGIFASTGQDLACIHESSTGILQMEKTDTGLYLSLTLPNLVVGTVGGGTHLPVATKILELMKCKGSGKAGRFAKMIAGFALSLEVSTIAAIVSGQFARAHQKHGRNKPIKYLLRSEITQKFVEEILSCSKTEIESVSFHANASLNEGVLMNLTKKVSKKVIGFIEMDFHLKNGSRIPVLLKSKATDEEVFDGLHFMASNLDVRVADLLNKGKYELEYKNCHKKEIEVYEALRGINYPNIPSFYGGKVDRKREIYLLLMERLDEDQVSLFNSEMTPELWSELKIRKAIDAINKVHSHFSDKGQHHIIPSVEEFQIQNNLELYRGIVNLNRKDYGFMGLDSAFEMMIKILLDWETAKPEKKAALTLIHNDFNPRNVALRLNDQICIYDWELACFDLPQRDVFEFLSFTITDELSYSKLENYMKYHFELMKDFSGESYNWEDYKSDFLISGESFLLSRIGFYLSGSTLVHYPFIQRVFKTTLKMLALIKKNN